MLQNGEQIQRMVICDIAFETITYCKDDIVKQLASDPELSIRFKVPLRDREIYVDMEIDGGELPRFEDDEGDLLLTANDKYDWNAVWDISDSIMADNDEI